MSLLHIQKDLHSQGKFRDYYITTDDHKEINSIYENAECRGLPVSVWTVIEKFFFEVLGQSEYLCHDSSRLTVEGSYDFVV